MEKATSALHEPLLRSSRGLLTAQTILLDASVE